jgi:hypothetical protein
MIHILTDSYLDGNDETSCACQPNGPYGLGTSQTGDEMWLIGREMGASKKIFIATGILVFNFELLINGQN